MNEIIRIETRSIGEGSSNTCDARELHRFLEVGKDFSTWIRDRVRQYGFIENHDFISLPKTGEQDWGGSNRLDYFIGLDMAKELCMVERNEKGKQARTYFIDCEKRLRALPAVTPDQLARAMTAAIAPLVAKIDALAQRPDRPICIELSDFISKSQVAHVKRALGEMSRMQSSAPWGSREWKSGRGRLETSLRAYLGFSGKGATLAAIPRARWVEVQRWLTSTASLIGAATHGPTQLQLAGGARP